MKIVEFAGNASIGVIDVEVPAPGAGEVIIQTAASAICGSEMHAFRGAGIAGGNGGHEAVGTVAALGADVTNLRVGQRVGASAIAGCGDCPACELGRYTWCDGHKFYGGMHAENFVAAANACYPLPDDLPWEAAALLTGDGMGVPWHTSKKIQSADIETIAVIGLGPIGLGNVLLQSHLGRRVIGVDIVDYRLALASQLGADCTIKADDTLIEQIMALTAGVGVDVAIDAAGRRETVANCFLAVRRGGTVVFNGETNLELLAPSRDFIRRDIWAVGSWYYHFSEIDEMMALWRAGLDVGALITHQFPLERAADAYDLFSRGLTGKVLLRP